MNIDINLAMTIALGVMIGWILIQGLNFISSLVLGANEDGVLRDSSNNKRGVTQEEWKQQKSKISVVSANSINDTK